MLSFRASAAAIGVSPDASFSYLEGFASRPASLRTAMRSMAAPDSEGWQEVSDIFRDDDWTDETQGVAWDNANWIFSCDARQSKPGHNDKSLYVFRGGDPLTDDGWVSRLKYLDVPHPKPATEGDDHWGQLTYFEGQVYVGQYWETAPSIPGVAFYKPSAAVVFDDLDGVLTFNRWVEIERVKSPSSGDEGWPELQAVNPWDGDVYTCFGGGDIREFFRHDRHTGEFKGTFPLQPAVRQVQGACFSPNGHLYIATNERYPDDDHQAIWCHSALTGLRMGSLAVLAEEDDQELEGICCASVTAANGEPAQIHAVLLENRDLALDNIFFKSFGCASPELV